MNSLATVANEQEKDMYTFRTDNNNDWAEVLKDGTVIYRGHIDEAREALVDLVATVEEVTVTGPRLDRIDQVGSILS